MRNAFDSCLVPKEKQPGKTLEARLYPLLEPALPLNIASVIVMGALKTQGFRVRKPPLPPRDLQNNFNWTLFAGSNNKLTPKVAPQVNDFGLMISCRATCMRFLETTNKCTNALRSFKAELFRLNLVERKSSRFETCLIKTG